MGSPLGPTLANILMTTFEDEIVRPLISSDVIKFYSCYIDDTLVLIRPSDIATILQKFNSFHPQIQFTHEEFTDNNDIHFLDINISSSGTSSFRKSTHTGQYVHLSSFIPWCRGTVWLRALVHRVHKICSNSLLLKTELQNIAHFASWNGYPRRLTNKLIESFTPKPNANDITTTNTDDNTTELPKIWIQLPFIKKRGNVLIKSCTTKITRLLKQHAQFITIHDTTSTNTFVSMKDRTPKELQSRVVYKFSCPGCQASYIGKTDHFLMTRIKEHAHDKESEIYKHINSCEHFLYYRTLFNFPHTLHNFDDLTSESMIFNNCNILDKSRHWSLLLFKESLHIYRHRPELNHRCKASKDLVIFN